jgi:hypothetical protein
MRLIKLSASGGQIGRRLANGKADVPWRIPSHDPLEFTAASVWSCGRHSAELSCARAADCVLSPSHDGTDTSKAHLSTLAYRPHLRCLRSIH